jgi:hypothetical protein
LQNALGRLFNSQTFSDASIILETENNTKLDQIYAHKAILSIGASQLKDVKNQFRSFTNSQFHPDDKGEIHLKTTKDELPLLKIALKFLYCGQIETISNAQVIPLLQIAKKFGIKSLAESCGEILGTNFLRNFPHLSQAWKSMQIPFLLT